MYLLCQISWHEAKELCIKCIAWLAGLQTLSQIDTTKIC